MTRYLIDIYIADANVEKNYAVVVYTDDLDEVGRILEEALADIETWEEDV